MADALDLFRALGDPTRLRIVALLRSMELAVGELAQVLGQSQPRVSRHVKILCDAGVARRRKEGSWVFVAMAEEARIDPLLQTLDIWPWGKLARNVEADAALLAAVRADRAAAAAQWFQDHAGEWDAIRSLYVPETRVEAAMTQLLAGSDLGRLVDIGTGTGRMLELFGPAAASALGIDRSSEMLRIARGKLSAQGLDADLRQADFQSLPLADGGADTALLHHVLHFAQAPELVIGEAARVLAANGRLMIVDFAPHAREELRTRDAHSRLGFSDDQMTGWFAEAGLMPVRTETLEGGELTVKIWLARKVAGPVLEVEAA